MADGHPAGGIAKRGKRVTMADIAREAGCSQATVSVVLNNNYAVNISPATRRRVKDIARASMYDFRASSGRRRADKDTRKRIAMVADSIGYGSTTSLAYEGVRAALRGTGAIAVLADTESDGDVETGALQMFIDLEFDAIIYTCLFTREIEIPTVLRQPRIPVILLNCFSKDLVFPSVIPAEITGGQRATAALIELGHTRIGMITGDPYMQAAKERTEGYYRALSSASIMVEPELVREAEFTHESGYRETRELMQLPEPPTAIFCQSDHMAAGCYEALQELGLKIPDDVSVVGYDNMRVADRLSPRLSTVQLPMHDMGIWAVETLNTVGGPDGPGHAVTRLDCPLVPGESTAPPRT